MRVRIFSEIIGGPDEKENALGLKKIQESVEEVSQKVVGTEVQWLQSSGATAHYPFTRLTAIVTFPATI